MLHSKKGKKRGYKVSLDGIILEQQSQDAAIQERINLLYKSIRELGDMDRAIVFLFLEGKKYEEIGIITGLSKSNVGTRMVRIKEKLKKRINTY